MVRTCRALPAATMTAGKATIGQRWAYPALARGGVRCGAHLPERRGAGWGASMPTWNRVPWRSYLTWRVVLGIPGADGESMRCAFACALTGLWSTCCPLPCASGRSLSRTPSLSTFHAPCGPPSQLARPPRSSSFSHRSRVRVGPCVVESSCQCVRGRAVTVCCVCVRATKRCNARTIRCARAGRLLRARPAAALPDSSVTFVLPRAVSRHLVTDTRLDVASPQYGYKYNRPQPARQAPARYAAALGRGAG